MQELKEIAVDVRTKITEFATKLLDRVRPYIEEQKPEPTTHRCCISLEDNHVTIIHINKLEDTTEILLTESLHYDHLDNLSLVLSGLVSQYELEGMPMYWLLSQEAYQFFLIESLPVPKEEFLDALNWRIKSLIAFPVEDAAIDYFNLPPKKASATSSMLAVAIAKKSYLKPYIDIFKQCGLRLEAIDIPELALRNLSAAYETDEKNTAFLYFHNNDVLMNITSEKKLYFSRRLSIEKSSESASRDYETLSLEIMRYLDYFQSQWRRPMPSRVFVGSERENTKEIAEILSKNLLITVEPYSIKSVLADKNKLHLLEKKYLLTLGCAMREDINSA